MLVRQLSNNQSEWSVHGEDLKSFAYSDQEGILCICRDKDDGRNLVRRLSGGHRLECFAIWEPTFAPAE